jgi:hypothetical protein
MTVIDVAVKPVATMAGVAPKVTTGAVPTSNEVPARSTCSPPSVEPEAGRTDTSVGGAT